MDKRPRAPQVGMARNNLGLALRLLGERKRDATIVLEALESHIMAWKVFMTSAPYLASQAKGNTEDALNILKTNFNYQIDQKHLARYENMLKNMGVFVS